MQPQRLLLLAPLLLLGGCTGTYAGGPTEDEPHGIVQSGADISIWAIDGQPTSTRNFSVRIAPGRRTIKVRIEFPIESDSAKPYEYRELPLFVEKDTKYTLWRKQEEHPPYTVEITEATLE